MLVATVRALKHHGGDLEGARPRSRPAPPTSRVTSGSSTGTGCRRRRREQVPDRHRGGARARPASRAEAGAYAAEINTAFEDGGAGATALAEAVVAAADEPNTFDFAYPLDAPIEEKIRLIATRVYGADGVELLPAAKKKAPTGPARARAASDLHGEDAPLALARSGAQERADRLHW